jgi:hypothetical protein
MCEPLQGFFGAGYSNALAFATDEEAVFGFKDGLPANMSAFSVYLPTLLRAQFGLAPADAGFRDLHDVARQSRCDLLEARSVDSQGAQISRVDTDNARTGVERARGLFLGVNLDHCGHAKRLHALTQPDQRVLFEHRDD